jgi:hypothetical protein
LSHAQAALVFDAVVEWAGKDARAVTADMHAKYVDAMLSFRCLWQLVLICAHLKRFGDVPVA